MPQFDVFALADGGLVVDCQADLLDELDTRLVVPLLPPGRVVPIARLNPAFTVEGETMIMYPQGAATIPRSELKLPLLSVAEHRYVLLNALDLLITGT